MQQQAAAVASEISAADLAQSELTAAIASTQTELKSAQEALEVILCLMSYNRAGICVNILSVGIAAAARSTADEIVCRGE